jgi:hypothetical protein
MKDPAFPDEIKKRNHRLDPATGEELEAIVTEAIVAASADHRAEKKGFSGDKSKGGRGFQ